MMRRLHYEQALFRTGVLSLLAPFDPHVAGTPPLGIETPSSDIDILCHAADQSAFVKTVWSALSTTSGFSMHQWTKSTRPVVTAFNAEGWRFEIFASPLPVAAQDGWRHFQVERRLLDLGGDAFRARVMKSRLTGLKTEPAFAAAMGLGGDPYEALLDLERLGNVELRRILSAGEDADQLSAASSPGKA